MAFMSYTFYMLSAHSAHNMEMTRSVDCVIWHGGLLGPPTPGSAERANGRGHERKRRQWKDDHNDQPCGGACRARLSGSGCRPRSASVREFVVGPWQRA